MILPYIGIERGSERVFRSICTELIIIRSLLRIENMYQVWYNNYYIFYKIL